MKLEHTTILLRIRALIFALGALVGLYIALGFWVIPWVIVTKLPTLLRQNAGLELNIQSAKFDPFLFQLQLGKLILQEKNSQLLASFDELYIDLDLWESLRQSSPNIDAIVVKRPTFHLTKNRNGQLNIDHLRKSPSKDGPTQSSVSAFTIHQFSIVDGQVGWQDQSGQESAKETTINLNASIHHLSTGSNQTAEYDFLINIPDVVEMLKAQGTFSLNPFLSSGHVQLKKLSLQQIQAIAGMYLPIPFKLQGLVNFDTQYQSKLDHNPIQIALNQGKFELNNLSAATFSNETLFKQNQLAGSGIHLDLNKHEWFIDSLISQGLETDIWLAANGKTNWEPLFTSTQTKSDTSQTVSHSSPWDIRINLLAINELGINFEDRALAVAVKQKLKPVNIKVTNISNRSGTRLPFQANVVINDVGSINLEGSLIANPLSAEMKINLQSLPLPPLQTYFDKVVHLDVISGALSVNGEMNLTKALDDTLKLSFTGNSKLFDLITRDQIKNQDFIKWNTLALDGIAIDWPANHYFAQNLIIDQPYVKVVINKDKTANFNDIFIRTNPGLNHSTTQIATKPVFKLDKVQIINGSSDFADFSLILPFAAQIKSLDGGARGISSEQKSTIKIELHGNAYDLAPVDIKGEVRPFLGNYDVQLDFKGLPMPLISSYMVQFAGYKVEKGKMSLALNYKVADRELSATNTILIDQFELGEKIDNPNAVSLPLDLAIALMKDSDGKIKMHVPISGSLEDPHFSLVHVFTDVLVNSISKIISSPFRALASLIKSEQDLSAITFAAGKATLEPSQISKLNDLVKALNARPELKLEIKGIAFQNQDWPAISESALYDQLKQLKAAELTAKSNKKIHAQYLELSDQDYRRLLSKQFVEKFPTMIEKSLWKDTSRLIDAKDGDFYQVAKQKLSAILAPEQQRLKNLATERAQAIARYLVQKHLVNSERIFILDTDVETKANRDLGIASQLSLGN